MFKHTFAAGLLALSITAHAHAGEVGKTSVTVYKTPWCGCCQVWTDAIEAAGYTVAVHDVEDLSAIKKQAGVPDDMQACHTAVIGEDRKYILEGHVPIEAIGKLMSERPDIRGISVPGMPEGSLGMGYDPSAKYTVYALGNKPSDQPEPFMTTGE
ncbi:MAG: DUF411 domain-containing protein [Roseibium sp.]|uniref:DUF411 domain-containing protein n=1 Tax=Roseibium sp. TaxID=1936156 RepID=UPI001AFF8429|nr:DUF411 domain-containing protein [Roseibium sp.]MBO6508326.1 DUF411 domain-containing protein [Roseibium sp.]MBO6895219.1 DUF411 domain-containing protein [Roseibium sp.]MBO6932340.1 DUF411 domain-containing protein [Roseibium sp.]